jgi:hypothetical protein
MPSVSNVSRASVLETLATDNPAVTVPASANVLPPSQPQTGDPQYEKVEKKEKDEDIPATLTKYDLGWRRVVRNFSPSYVPLPL